MDNLAIVAPKKHDEIHAEIDEQGIEQNQETPCKKHHEKEEIKKKKEILWLKV